MQRPSPISPSPGVIPGNEDHSPGPVPPSPAGPPCLRGFFWFFFRPREPGDGQEAASDVTELSSRAQRGICWGSKKQIPCCARDDRSSGLQGSLVGSQGAGSRFLWLGEVPFACLPV